MTALGQFQLLGNDGSAKRYFVVEGSELAVDESSVSSEWTTESEDNVDLTGSKVGAKKRTCTWRVRHKLGKHRHLKDGSTTSGSASSSSSTSSSSESASDKITPAQPKRRSRNDRRMQSIVHKVGVGRPSALGSSILPSLQWAGSPKKYRRLAFATGFLDSAEIAAIAHAAHHPSVKEIHDRKAYLAFKHRVVRFEMQLRAMAPALYAKLLALMRLADAEGWRRLRKKKPKVYPEIEYIEYDVHKEGGECYIEPHVDNKSGVTLVAMLSPSTDYIGGNSCFRRSKGSEGHRQTRLEQGDVVMFRGEKLLHWITNVTAGRRVILQIELSRV